MNKPETLMLALMAMLVMAFSLLSLQPAAAEDVAKRSWMPMPAKATGGKCDADPAWMRKWHMRALDHKRDETMHEGIRTDQFSLKRCITCHAVKDESGKFVTVKDERHFCRTCHDYAAVSVDCFDCHASRPGSGEGDMAALPDGHPKLAAKGEATALAAMEKHFAGEDK
jgi:predicted CXXCH cytochrome family protein